MKKFMDEIVSGWNIFWLCDQVVDYLAGYIGQAVPAPLMFKCQFLVVEAHEFEDGGVEVVDVDGVPGDVIAEVIRFAIDAGLDAAACHPDGEATRVMVTAIVIRRQRTLAIIG